MDTIGILGLFCGIGVALAFFLFYLFVAQGKDNLRLNLLAGSIFLAAGLRIGKSIWHFILHDVTSLGVAFGFLGLSMIGPSIYLLVRYAYGKHNTQQKWDIFHLLFPIAGFFTIAFIYPYLDGLLYEIATIVLLGYVLVAYAFFFRREHPSKGMDSLVLRLLLSALIFLCAFSYQHLSGTIVNYAIGAAVSSVPMFYMLAFVMSNGVNLAKSKLKQIPKEAIHSVKGALEGEKVFLQKNITISRFAENIQIPAYQVTRVVKDLYGKSFPETVNSFRIDEAKTKLVNGAEEFIKVEGLAHDVGFNTTSTFYAAFKKETGMSPKEFQKKQLS